MNPIRILVVHDSKSARFALRNMLKKSAVEVELAESGEAALEVLKNLKPNAIFMDHMMPGMDGFETTRAIKKDPSTAQIPVFMCTSNEGDSYVTEAKSLGARGILPKPATPERIAEVLAALESEAQAMASEPAIAETATPAMVRDEVEAIARDQANALLEEILQSRVQELVEARIATLREEIEAAARNTLESAEQAARSLTESIVEETINSRLPELVDSRLGSIREDLESAAGTARTAGQKIDELQDQIASKAREEASSAAAAIQDTLQGQIAVLGAQTLAAAREEIVPAATASAREIADTAISDHSDALAARIGGQIEDRVGSLKSELESTKQAWLEEARSAAVTAGQEAASEEARRVAEETAQVTARQTAQETAKEALAGATLSPAPGTTGLERRMAIMAALAAGIGLLSAIVVYFLK